MNLSESIEPRSDQLNSDDLMAGPITVTIERVSAGNAEQPVNVHLAERPGRPYRPSKSMRRVMVQAWGPDGDAYAGKRLTLYRDPNVTFGRDKVGGIKISHMSGITQPMDLALTVTRGKRAPHHVDPLPDTAPATYTIPELHTVEEARAHYIARQREGASAQELAEIQSQAATLPTDGDNQ